MLVAGRNVTSLDDDCGPHHGLEEQWGVSNPCLGSTPSRKNQRWDLFLSHLQCNGQDAIISMQLFLKQAHPGLRCFVDLEVDMKGNLEQSLQEGVAQSAAFVFFITDGILTSPWCEKELRWALEFKRNVVLVRETDERHGGIDMKNFIHQVPDDLKHVFTNIIAVPWYRQPQFRDVSVRAILKAAKVVDAYSQDCAALEKAKLKLEMIFEGSVKGGTAIDIIEEYSFAMRAVFFLGGFSRFKSTRLDWLYVFIFNVSFWTCTILCGANLVYRTVPYHVLPTDFLTMWAHVPAWQSWRCWRRFVASEGCDQLLSTVRRCESNERPMRLACHFGGLAVLGLQVCIVGVVLAGFSLPFALKGMDWGANAHGPHRWAVGYTGLHSHVMWGAVPPVIAAMLASYAMFSFMALLHWLDIQALRENATECSDAVARFQTRTRIKHLQEEDLMASAAEGGVDSRSCTADLGSEVNSLPTASGGVQEDLQDLQTKVLNQQMEDKLYKMVTELLGTAVATAQNRMDKTCAEMGSLWLHLVCLSTCQVLAITRAFQSHASGPLHSVNYSWWWGPQDFFHFAGGLALLFAGMGAFCIVTTTLQAVPQHVVEQLRKAGCPADRLGAIAGLLTVRPLGMHVLRGSLYVDVPRALGFLVLLLTIVLSGLISIAGALDRPGPHR